MFQHKMPLSGGNAALSWLDHIQQASSQFIPHGHCYLWLPGLLWMHVVSDVLIGTAYLGISVIFYLLVRRIRLPFSPMFVAFGLFIGLCGLTHFMKIWIIWNPDYLAEGLLKTATALASVATAVGLLWARPQVENMVHAARLSEERRIQLESAHTELQSLYAQVKQLDLAKTRFFANVSHELRTPLTLILGPAERMLGEPGLTPGQRRHMESISRHGKSLLKQVNDLLDIAKLEAGKVELRAVCLDVAPWFRRVSAQFEQAAEQRQIDYRVEAPDSLVAETDPDMLERVLVNLLSNAFKFTPPQGRIEARLEAKDAELIIGVADSGPGIPDDQQAAIFERFHQVDGNSGDDSHKPGGTGLGLAIVKEYVQLHGGSMGVASVPGHGATFTARLPLRAPVAVTEVTKVTERPQAWPRDPALDIAFDNALAELTPQASGDGLDRVFPFSVGAPSVLVVEDNPDMRAFVGRTLSLAYHVVTAADGQEGLERALALHPDLLITDLMMPRMGGDQLVQALRARSEFNSMPIMLLTARDDDELRVRLLKSGAQDFVSKPFLPQELLARAENLVTLKRTGDTLRAELLSASGDVKGLANELARKHRQLQTALDSAEVAREQVERASQVKSHFLGMISHELRTPLSTIRLNAQLLARAGPAPAPDPRIDRLMRAARQMSTLVEGLLEYTRAESAKVTARPESVDLAALARDVIEAHADNVHPGLHLVMEPPPLNLPPLVTDPRLLRVVMSNLVSNALKFTPQGRVTVRLASAQGWHSFEVTDTGVGMATADVARIFLPFEQLESVQRKSIPGVGLGLTLVKMIVENLGGQVEVVAAPGSGCTFRVLLPSQRPASEVPADAA